MPAKRTCLLCDFSKIYVISYILYLYIHTEFHNILNSSVVQYPARTLITFQYIPNLSTI